MSHEIRADYNQQWLFPPSLNDLLPADHPARFIQEFVDALDLKAMGFRMRKGVEGRPNYAPDLLLKVWLYGYLERVRSSRKLERACRQHIGLMWLTGLNLPDHNSLWRFWNENRKALKEVFRMTIQVALKADLIDMVLNAVDGTKITAKASTDKVWNRKTLEGRLERLEKSINQIMAEVEESEDSESGEYRLPQELAEKEKLRETIREKLSELKKEERQHIHPGEPDAEMMKNHEGTRLAYNAQAVVDGKAGMIVAGEITRDKNDKAQLVPMIEAAEDSMGKAAQETIADAGYFSGEQLAKAENAKYSVIVSLDESRKAEEMGGVYHSSNFKYDEVRDCVICPQNQVLAYERTYKGQKRPEAKVYRCKCKDCPVASECSSDKRGRTVKISSYLEHVLRQKHKQKDQAIRDLLRRRMGIVEPAFARVKHLLEFRRWTVAGIDKVKAQWLFVCALVNMTRLYPLWRKGELQFS
jgi:transposase